MSPSLPDVRWEKVLFRLQELARRLCTLYGIPIQHAEEMVQETLVRILSCAARYDAHRGPLDPWVAGVLNNVAREYLRRVRLGCRHPARSDEHIARASPRADAPEQVASDLEVWSLAKSYLSKREFRLVVGRWFLGIPLPKLAAQEGVTVPSARASLNRARSKLGLRLHE